MKNLLRRALYLIIGSGVLGLIIGFAIECLAFRAERDSYRLQRDEFKVEVDALHIERDEYRSAVIKSMTAIDRMSETESQCVESLVKLRRTVADMKIVLPPESEAAGPFASHK